MQSMPCNCMNFHVFFGDLKSHQTFVCSFVNVGFLYSCNTLDIGKYRMLQFVIRILFKHQSSITESVEVRRFNLGVCTCLGGGFMFLFSPYLGR